MSDSFRKHGYKCDQGELKIAHCSFPGCPYCRRETHHNVCPQTNGKKEDSKNTSAVTGCSVLLKDVIQAVFYTKEYKEKKKIRDASREIMNIKTRTCFTQLFPYYHKMGNYPCEEFREQSKDCAGKHWYGCANPFKRIYADLPDV